MPISFCSKVSYSSISAAARALRAISALNDPRRREKAIHWCGQCRGFHLTSRAKSINNKWMRQAAESAKASNSLASSRR